MQFLQLLEESLAGHQALRRVDVVPVVVVLHQLRRGNHCPLHAAERLRLPEFLDFGQRPRRGALRPHDGAVFEPVALVHAFRHHHVWGLEEPRRGESGARLTVEWLEVFFVLVIALLHDRTNYYQAAY